MALPQIRPYEMISGISVFNLALNVAGIINNQKNVSLYITNEETGAKEDILDSGSVLGTIDKYTDLVGITPAIIDAEIMENCKLAEHPLENGKVRADNKIMLPKEITVKIALPATQYEDVWNKIKTLKEDNTMISVQTKNQIFDNLQIVGLPFSLNVDNVSRIILSIKLKEVLIPEKKKNPVAQQFADYTTQSTGNKLGLEMPFNLGVFL